MPIAVSGGSPARVTAVSGDEVTTAGFDAPAGSVVVACVSAVTDSADTYSAALSDSEAGDWTDLFAGPLAELGPELIADGQDGFVGMWARTAVAAETGMTVTAEVTGDVGGGITDTLPTLKVYVLTGADLADLGTAQFAGVTALNNVNAGPSTAFVPGRLLVVAATEANDLGEPASGTSGATVDAFDGDGISGLSLTLPIGDPAPASVNVNAAGTDPAAWRLLGFEFAPRLTASLIDGFEDGAIDNPPWATVTNGATETGGGLELPCVAGFATVVSGLFYDFTASEIFAEMSEVPVTGAGTTQAFMRLILDGANQIRIGKQGANLIGERVTTGPTFTNVFSVAYNATDHRFIRMSEAAGTVTMSTSPNGETWTSRGTFLTSALTSAITAYRVEFRCGFTGGETPPLGLARFEGINVLPHLHPDSIPSEEDWGIPELEEGALSVFPDSILSAEEWGTPTLFQAAIQLESIESEEAWGIPTLVQELIHPDSIASEEAWGLPTLIAGGLELGQLEWRGLIMGTGTPFVVERISGLLDRPDMRFVDQVRAQHHGLYTGTDYLAGRVVEATISVGGGNGPTAVAEFLDNVEALKAAVAEVGPERPLRVRWPALAGRGTREIRAKVRRDSIPEVWLDAAEAHIRWDASNPRIYDSTEQTLITPPEALPGTDGIVTANNIGSLSTPWKLRVAAGAESCTNPMIEWLGSGGFFLAFDPLTLEAGQELEVDVDLATVLVDGINAYSSRTLDSSWWEIPPGSSQLRFSVASGATAVAFITFRSAWLS